MRTRKFRNKVIEEGKRTIVCSNQTEVKELQTWATKEGYYYLEHQGDVLSAQDPTIIIAPSDISVVIYKDSTQKFDGRVIHIRGMLENGEPKTYPIHWHVLNLFDSVKEWFS